ncbi:MAG: TIGR01777 family oxidoreductase [Fimbriimonadaceae bacterium]
MSDSRKVVVAGGSGFIGRALCERLKHEGHEVVVLTRKVEPDFGFRQVVWDGETVGPWAAELEDADGVINLAGSPITVKWTNENKQKIIDSRVKTATAIGEAIQACENPPKVWVNASAIGFYGDRPGETLTEESPPGTGFLAETSVQWEAAQAKFETPETVQAVVRIGIVLGKGGGAYEELALLTKNYLGGSIGSGQMVMSWIHLQDLTRLFAWIIDSQTSGTFNGTSPHPATNAEFMKALRESLNRPWSPPAPVPVVKMVSSLKGVEPEVLLQDCRALPQHALDSGFMFQYSLLAGALSDLARE